MSISGPPDPAFGKARGLNPVLRLVMYFLSLGVRRTAKRLGVSYSFLLTKASGRQLKELTELIESGVVRPVVDKVYPFAETASALAYVENGRSRGKVVIAME